MNMIAAHRAFARPSLANADPNALLAQLNSAFTRFMSRNDGRLDEMDTAINDLCERGAAALLSPANSSGLLSHEIWTQFRATFFGQSDQRLV